jgi:3-oxoacyl-[acyl-carrier-protein] synthase III
LFLFVKKKDKKDMLGITEIGSYIPERKISNYSRKKKFDITDEFIKEKLGVESISIKESSENTSDLCMKAYENLIKKIDINPDEIEMLIVVTQNPDYTLPQTSAILHGKLELKTSCASFDISLGCSGFVYGLAAIQSFMEVNKMKKGLLFTCDPYSKIVSPQDKNTSMLFGDAAAVTLITDNPIFKSVGFTYGTMGSSYKELICENNELFMNGRAVSNFAAKVVPKDIVDLLEKNNMHKDDVDVYLFHQGSKFIISNLTKRLKLNPEKVVFDIFDYGNTVSSSLPILIEKQINNKENKTFLASGFGVGLSWSNVILERV